MSRTPGTLDFASREIGAVVKLLVFVPDLNWLGAKNQRDKAARPPSLERGIKMSRLVG